MVANWKEVGHFKDIPLQPNVSGFEALQTAGMLRLYTARETAGLLGGYALFIVTPDIHYMSSLQATMDVTYLDPAFRGSTAIKFLRWCDEQLMNEGVQVINKHVKASHNHGKIYERDGYELVNLMYSKKLF